MRWLGFIALLAACWNSPSPQLPVAKHGAWQLAEISPQLADRLQLSAQALSLWYGKVDRHGHVQDLTADTGVRFFVADPPPGERAGLASAITGTVTICKGMTCRDFLGGKAPLVIFSPAHLRTLDALIVLEHGPGGHGPEVADDAAWIALLDRVDRDPAAVIAEAHASATDEHLKVHWLLLGLYLANTALEGSLALPDGSTAEARGAACPNYTGGAETARWAAWHAADTHTVELLKSTIEALGEVGIEPADALTELGGDLLAMALWQWARRERALVHAACPDVAAQPFALMRCRCREADYWPVLARKLLDDFGPPMTVSAYRVLTELGGALRIDPPERLAAVIGSIRALDDGAMTIGRHACDAKTDRTRQLPALEGSRESRALFLPTPAQQADIDRACGIAHH